VDAFNIVIQGGAILAVLGLYWARVKQMVLGVLGRDAAGLRLAVNLLVAFLPAAVIGVLINDWVEARLFHIWPVAAALAVGGVYMIVLDRWRMRHLRAEDKRAEEAREAERVIAAVEAERLGHGGSGTFPKFWGVPRKRLAAV